MQRRFPHGGLGRLSISTSQKSTVALLGVVASSHYSPSASLPARRTPSRTSRSAVFGTASALERGADERRTDERARMESNSRMTPTEGAGPRARPSCPLGRSRSSGS